MAAAKKSVKKTAKKTVKKTAARKTGTRKKASAAAKKTAKKAKELGSALEMIGGVIEAGAAILDQALVKASKKAPEARRASKT
jgi:hypothetical protein